MDQRLGLLGDGAARPRCACPSDGDADAGEQVVVLATIGIVETHALATHERDRQPSIRLQHMPRFPRDDVVHHHRHAVTILRRSRVAASGAALAGRAFKRVPIPSVHDHHVVHAVASACSQARSLAIMPAVAVPSFDQPR